MPETKLYQVAAKGLKNAPKGTDINLTVWDTNKKHSFTTSKNLIVNFMKKIVAGQHQMYRLYAKTYKTDKSFPTEDFDVSDIKNLYDMFCDCEALESIDLSNFETSKNESMQSFFKNCKMLKSIDLSGLDTTSLLNMRETFYGCQSLISLDLSGFNTSKVGTMASAFEGCKSLATLDLSSFDTSVTRNMKRLFYGCSELVEIKGVIDMTSIGAVDSWTDMFKGCTKLKSVKFKNPPADFLVHDAKSGLNVVSLKKDQYEIVE